MNNSVILNGLMLVVATWAVEVVALWAVNRSRIKRDQVIDLFLVNLLTNPAANWLFTNEVTSFLQTEILVVLAETLPVAKILKVDLRKGLFFSLLLNSASALTGLFIFEIQV